MRYGLYLSITVLSAVLGDSAYAAVEITAESMTPDGKTSQHSIYLAPDRAKFDSERIALIIRTDTGKMVNVMKDKHQYMEIDPKELSARVAAAQAQMQQRLQSVPEAQRKQIEAMMAQHGGVPGAQAKPAVKTSYEKTGQTKTVGSWSCQIFHQKRDGNLVADLCIAPAAALGITKEDLSVFHAFAETMGRLQPQGVDRNVAMMDFDAQTQQIGFVGLPVETVTYLNGKMLTTTVVKSVAHAPLGADIFEVPAGYTRMEMPSFGLPGAASPGK